MTITPLPNRQREVLMLAEHGDVRILKGVAAQRKALVRKGLLDDDFGLTDIGTEQLAAEHALQAPMPFFEIVADLGADFHRAAHLSHRPHTNPSGYGVPHWIGAHSVDRRVVYATRRGLSNPVFAIWANTIPSEFRAFFGLSEV